MLTYKLPATGPFFLDKKKRRKAKVEAELAHLAILQCAFQNASLAQIFKHNNKSQKKKGKIK
jgi:hypothetical protein